MFQINFLFPQTGNMPDLMNAGIEHRYDQNLLLQSTCRRIHKNIKYENQIINNSGLLLDQHFV